MPPEFQTLLWAVGMFGAPSLAGVTAIVGLLWRLNGNVIRLSTSMERASEDINQIWTIQARNQAQQQNLESRVKTLEIVQSAH